MANTKHERHRPQKYDDPVKRTVQMERADWDFAWEYGSRNACLGIQRAIQEARTRKEEAARTIHLGPPPLAHDLAAEFKAIKESTS